MKRIHRYTAVALLPLLAACADDLKTGLPEGDAALPIVLKAVYPTATRASDGGFEDGDRMGLYVLDHVEGAAQEIDGNPHASNVRFEYDAASGSCRGVTDLYWTSRDTKADFVAYYPFSDIVDDPRAMAVGVERRQDTEGTETKMGGYEASDFLYARLGEVTPDGGMVNLTFGHALSGIKVVLVEGDGFDAGEWSGLEKSAVIMNTVTEGTVDLADGSVTVASDSEPGAVIPLSRDGEFRAVTIPQTVEAGKSLVSVTVGGLGYELVKTSPFTYVPGKLHTFTITVVKQGPGDYEFSLTTEGITPWLDSADFRDGIMRQYFVVEVPGPGQLKEVMASKSVEARRVYNLKLKGSLNHEDFDCIRENIVNLKAINLYETKVECYVDHGGGNAGIDKDMLPDAGLRGMSALTHVVFPRYVREIGGEFLRGSGIMGEITIPEGVEKIGYAAFMDCKSLRGVNFPTSLKVLGGGSFQRSGISGELVLPEGLEAIGGGAFQGTNLSGELHFPSTLKAIYEEAFRDCHFSGSLLFPQGIKEVPARCFSGFTGTLTLPEGVETVREEAFQDCGFRGELSLPSTLKSIERYAFAGTMISSVVFPGNIGFLGEGAFFGCSRLSGTVSIPKKITDVPRDLFNQCTLIDEVVLPAEVVRVNGGAFANCYNISSVTCLADEPPLLKAAYAEDNLGRQILVFDGVPRDNFTVQVPAKSVGKYQQAIEWSEFKRIAAYSNFVCRPAAACALNTVHTEELVLNADGPWTVTRCPDWISLSADSGSGKTSVSLTFKELAAGSADREDYVEFTMTGKETVTTRCDVVQRDYEHAEDACVTLQTHSKGNGIDIVFVGDGFDAEAIASGAYLRQVKEQIGYFFGIEPYKTYRDYFDVKVCFPLSQETGVNTANTWRNTAFGTYYSPPGSCSTGLLDLFEPDAVFDYVREKASVDAGKMSRSLVVLTLNSDEYGSNSVIADSGAAIAIVGRSSDPYPMDSRGLMQREAGGVAFGKLADERATRVMYLSKEERATIRKMNARGWYMNLSVSGNLNEVWWKDFIFDSHYSDKVDVFEGGLGKTRGCFRSEINSCMNFGIPYHSLASRYDIVRRIMDYAGVEFSKDSFLENDNDEWGDATRSAGAGLLLPPVSFSGRTKFYKSSKY